MKSIIYIRIALVLQTIILFFQWYVVSKTRLQLCRTSEGEGGGGGVVTFLRKDQLLDNFHSTDCCFGTNSTRLELLGPVVTPTYDSHNA